MPKIVVRIDAGITHEVVRRGIILPPVIEPGAKNLRTGMVYPGNTGPQAAIAAAQTGDIIEVVPEVYTGFACNVPRSITLRSSAVGEKFVLDIGNGQYRGLELANGVNLTLEDCELRNNKQEYSNAAGIWPTGGTYTLTIRRCLFSELNNGVMIGDHRQATVLIEDSIFENCGDYNGYSHNIYIGPVSSLTLRRVISRMTKNRADYGTEPWRVSWGHLVKSRAQRTVIEDCQLDQLGGEGNRCLDLPNGGDVTVLRTRMTLNTNIQNGGGGQMVSFGVEEATNPVGLTTHRFDMQDCDLVNNGGVKKQFVWAMTNAQGVPAPSWNVRGNRFVGFSAPRAKQTVGAEGAIYEPDVTLNTFDGVIVQPPPPAGGTVSNGVWTPQRASDGTITEASWADLPVGVVVEWAGTALESQLSTPYGAAGTFYDFGVSRIVDHFDGWSGAAFDEATGRFFCFGGGHAGSSNNMLSQFDSRTGRWSVAIPPTAVEAMPATYARTGLGGYTQVAYPDGRIADNFVPTWQPPGDGSPTAMHTYGGLLYVNGEVVKLRGGNGQTDEPGFRYWVANLAEHKWVKGGAMARPAYGVEQHATVWNGIVYWGMEGGQAGDNQYWTVTKYDVAQRKEVGTFGLNASGRGLAFGAWNGTFTAATAPGKWALGVAHGYAGANGLAVIDLATGATENVVPWTGEMVTGSYDNPGDLGAVWIPDWQRMLLLDQRRGRWLELDLATGVGVVARVQGNPPPCVNSVYGRLRYWPQRKVVILHSRTMQNAVIIRTG